MTSESYSDERQLLTHIYVHIRIEKVTFSQGLSTAFRIVHTIFCNYKASSIAQVMSGQLVMSTNRVRTNEFFSE